jgi:hypothetical protein
MQQEKETRMKFALPKNVNEDYLRFKRNLSQFHQQNREFKQMERDAEIKYENALLLSKLKDISTGKASIYGLNKLARNSSSLGPLNLRNQLD